MRKSLTFLLLLATLGVAGNGPWQPAGDRIKTPWAEKWTPPFRCRNTPGR